jgi:ABC-2 type transport system permease protein
MATTHPQPDLRVVSRRAVAALAGREVRRVLVLWTQTVVPSIVTGVLFLAIFAGALGDRLRQVDELSYLSFILPGLLVMTVATQAFANASTSLFQAKNEGYIEDLLSSPLRPAEIVLSYMAGAVVRGWLAAAAIAALALPFAEGLHQPAIAVIALALTAAVFGALGVITGLYAQTHDQHAFAANLVITPLALVAGVFYSVERLSEPWSTLTRLDPLYYLVDATRFGLTGVHEEPMAISLPLAAAVSVAVVTVAVTLVRRGWRLIP